MRDAHGNEQAVFPSSRVTVGSASPICKGARGAGIVCWGGKETNKPELTVGIWSRVAM